MGPVKTPTGVETVAGRMRLIRRALNPHGNDELPWPAFAKFAGVPLGTAKKWESRGEHAGISEELARQLAQRLTEAGYPCSWEWVRHGTGATPGWADQVGEDTGANIGQGDDDAADGGPAARAARRVGDMQSTRTAAPPETLDSEHDAMRREEAALVSEAVGNVVNRHEVVGVELRKVLIRMAAGLDALNHHDAAGEIYALLVKLNDIDVAKRKGKGTQP